MAEGKALSRFKQIMINLFQLTSTLQWNWEVKVKALLYSTKTENYLFFFTVFTMREGRPTFPFLSPQVTKP